MKSKIFIALMFMFAMVNMTQAQTVKVLTSSGDTVVNTGTKNLPYTVQPNAAYLTFQVKNVKLSGTVAGKTYLMESLDGVEYIKTDSITNLDITTNTAIWKKSPPFAKYYRISSTGTGTMSMRTYGYLFLWPH